MLPIKISHAGEIRRVQVLTDDFKKFSYDNLIETAKNLFPNLRNNDKFKVFWYDEDKDVVNCSSDLEVSEAVRVMMRNEGLCKFSVDVATPVIPVPTQRAAEATVHDSVTCDGCGVSPIIGTRYKCSVRHNYDLCGACESSGQQPYPMLKVYSAYQAPNVSSFFAPLVGFEHSQRREWHRLKMYFKMLKAGHSPEVVRQRMVVDGVDPALLDLSAADSKYRRMLRAGHSLESVRQLMREEGADPAELDRRDTDLDNRWRHHGPRRHWVRDQAVDGPDRALRRGGRHGWRRDDMEPAAAEQNQPNDFMGFWRRAVGLNSAAAAPFTPGADLHFADAGVAELAPPRRVDDEVARVDQSLQSMVIEAETDETHAAVPATATASYTVTSVDRSTGASFPASAASNEAGALATSSLAGSGHSESYFTKFVPTFSPAASALSLSAPVTKPMARFVKDVTLPDGAYVFPGASAVKTWRVRNDGERAWPEGVTLVFSSGDLLAASVEALTVSVPSLAPGTETDVSVSLAIPEVTGRHVTYFRLRTREGALFGQRLWVDLRVNDEVNLGESSWVGVGTTKPEAEASTKEDDRKPAAVSEPPQKATPSTPSVPAPAPGPTAAWAKELQVLADMGFTDTDALIPMLQEHVGVPVSSSPQLHGVPPAEGMQRIVAALLSQSGRF